MHEEFLARCCWEGKHLLCEGIDSIILYTPQFLENQSTLEFVEKTVRQEGHPVENAGDAALPPWAKGSPREFISKHWEARDPDFLRKFASLDRPYFWIQAKSERKIH